MKKTLLLGLIATALGFSACSTEDEFINDGQTQKKGMVLNATVAQPAESRATIDDATDNWQFAFSTNDVVKVTNTTHTGYYAFTNNGRSFICRDAEPTAEATTWYAYFPTTSISLANQEGSLASVANKFALAGATDPATTGAEGLSITMEAKVAILKINNMKGSLNIQVKTSATDYVVGLQAKKGEAGFDVVTSTTPTSVFATTNLGTYYVAVPAGVQIAVKNGNTTVKSTKETGLAAGKYYELTIGSSATLGTAKANINGEEVDVPWVQLWAGGPKFATFNIGATEDNPCGGYYTWGGSEDLNKGGADDYNTGSSKLTGDADTATKLWGSNWRMPTKEEIQTLVDDCHFDEYQGRFSGHGEDHCYNNIFIPLGGSYYNGEVGGDFFAYWSSTPNGDDKAYFLNADPNPFPYGAPAAELSSSSRSSGFLVRAVLNEDGDVPKVAQTLLKDEFSVGANKKVKFTRGNLYWNKTSNEFKFEANQTDFPDTWDSDHVGHFYWSKDNSKLYIQVYSDAPALNDIILFDERNGGMIVEGTDELYALSQAEWHYLLEERPNATSLRQIRYVAFGGNQIKCLVIAPDNYSGWLSNIKDPIDLQYANSEGFVCLPAAGYRDGDPNRSRYGNFVDDKFNEGYYWSTTPDVNTEGRALQMHFTRRDIYSSDVDNAPRGIGSCVRLVKTVK